MEIFDLYDENNNLLNKKMVRGTSNNKGEYHKVVHIWIVNSKGEYLIQKRNKATDKVPYQWAPTAGALQEGEKPIDSAIREVKEELGLDIDKKDFQHLKQFKVEDSHANFFIELFIVKKDINLKNVVFDKIEVQDVCYASSKDIKALLNQYLFWDFKSLSGVNDYFEKLERVRI